MLARTAPGNPGERMLAVFAGAGFASVEPAILQPSALFLDVSGEDIRKRMFVTSDEDGREWCLRPDYTIPVCVAHLAGTSCAVEGRYSYAGPVFRMQGAAGGEFQQTGIEAIGGDLAEAIDAEVLALTCEALRVAGLGDPRVVMGDVALLQGLARALALPAVMTRRLMRGLASGHGADALATLTPDAAPDERHAGLLGAIDGQDPAAARAFVEDVLSIAGIRTVGGRSAADIADRFLTRAGTRGQAVTETARAVIGEFLAIDAAPDIALERLQALANRHDLAIEPELTALENRIGFIAAQGLDVEAIRFQASFARNLDYYTSFVFELHGVERQSPPVAGGGRYDTLLSRLGAPLPCGAVGAAIWPDRLKRALA